jgi:putative tricarboxylic transport membrane protein
VKLTAHSKGELAFSGLLLALGIFVIAEAAVIPIPVAASNVGPRFMPYFAGGLLTLAAAWTIVELFRGHSVAPEESELADPSQKLDWKRVSILIGSVVAFAILLDPLGYLLAAPIALFGLLLSFGARRWWVMALVAVVLPVLIYLFFSRTLGISLPDGLLAGIL